MPSQYGSLAPEPIENDTLTKFLNSITNMGAQQGSDVFSAGQGAYQKGMQGFDPAMQYWQSILSGNKSEMESAVAPEKESIMDRYRATKKGLAKRGSRSGGTNEAVASAGFSEAGDIGRMFQTLRPQAAKESAGLADSYAKLGLAEQGIGLQEFMGVMQGLLQRRGQNIGQETANLGMLTSGLSGVFSALI
jgi:hypothetical protein